MRSALLLLPPLLLACEACEQPHPTITRDMLQSLPQAALAPADSHVSTEVVELGRLLFWDPILSGNKDVACATCHHPSFGYADGLPVSIGVGGQGLGPNRQGAPGMPLVPRNAPTVLNTGFNGWTDSHRSFDPSEAPMFWDSRDRGLEAQALGPIRSSLEMRGDAYPRQEAIPRVLRRLADTPEYVRLFAQAYEADPAVAVSVEHLARAIAAFERHLSQPNSPYDRWLAGDDDALGPDERRGLNAFHGIGCADCHSGPMLSDYKLSRIGVPGHPGIDDQGDGSGRFRTPSLRNVALTRPYTHSGGIGTLREMVAFYDDLERPGLDPRVRDMEIDDGDMDSIESFLRALTDDFDRGVPARVPSGLPPGGNIEH